MHKTGNWAVFGFMITYIKLVKMGQKFPAFLTQKVQFWWGDCVSLMQNGRELASLCVDDRPTNAYVYVL